MGNGPLHWNRQTAAHLLVRAAWGASPEEIDRATRDGFEATLVSLFNDESDDDLFPEPVEFHSEQWHKMWQTLPKLPKNSQERRDLLQALHKAEKKAIAQLRDWWIARMRYSPCPLRERMVLFWHGHFATSFEKVRSSHAMLRQNHLFRDFAFGRFEELALAVSRDEAMMRYLDVAGSSKKHPNENFARELLELFTLGEGHYTEEDVREAARAFTGWGIDPVERSVQFLPRRFDNGEKTVLGTTGHLGAEECVQIVCRNSQCARFVTRKLWEEFAGVSPSREVQLALAEVFESTGGNIRLVLEELFRRPEFYSQELRGRRVKSPVEWLVGTLKNLDMPVPGPGKGTSAIQQLGQNLFAPPSVRGWEGGQAWISATTLLARQRLAPALFLPIPEKLVPKSARDTPEELAAQVAKILMPAGMNPAILHEATTHLARSKFPADSETVSRAFLFYLQHPDFQIL